MGKEASKPKETDALKLKEISKETDALKKKKIATQMGISFVRFILLFGLCFLIIQPILNKVSISFMAQKDCVKLQERIVEILRSMS